MRAVLGHAVMMGDRPPPGLAAYAETADADHPGNTRPSGHLPVLAVERYRLSMWGRSGGAYAPPAERDRAVAFVVERERRKAQRMADAQVEAAKQADVYGFNTSGDEAADQNG
jgi:hypothetical protein